MTVRTSLHRIFSLLLTLPLLFLATNLAAQTPSNDAPPQNPDDATRIERQELPPTQDPSTNEPIGIDQPPNPPADNGQNLEISTAVDAFSEFVSSFQRDQAYKTYINTYTIRGLRSLTDTLGALIRPGDDQLIQEQKTLYNQIVNIETMPFGERDSQPGLVPDAVIDAATLFVNVQRQYYPNYDKQAQEIARLAAAISPDTPIKDQTDEINRFFLTTALTLEHIAQQPLNPIGGGPLANPGQQTPQAQNIDPTPDPTIDPNLTPPFDPNVDPNVSDDLTPYDDNTRPTDAGQSDTDTGNDYPNTPGTQPYDPDPLNPTYPVDPTEPLDPTDPMEPTPLGPAQPFDATNPRGTAPLDY